MHGGDYRQRGLSSMRKLVTFDVSLDLMAGGLKLPKGTEVVHVTMSPFEGCVRYTVRHPDLPGTPGPIPYAVPRVTSHIDDFGYEYKSWDWNIQEEGGSETKTNEK